jgi:hypothetical protein
MSMRAPRFALTAEDRAITEGYAAGVPIAVIARSVGIKPKRVAHRAQVLRIKHLSRNRSLEERFWGFVNPEPNTGCFLWAGALSGAGRAQIASGGSAVLASHVAMQLAGKPVPAGLFALHRCDNPACVNPDHMFVGGQLENMQDCAAKGRNKPRQARDACSRGHLLSGNNLYHHPKGGRQCKECRKVAERTRRAARSASL